MKKILLMFIISICGIAWRSEDIMKALGMLKTVSEPQAISVKSLTVAQDPKVPSGMSLTEYAKLTKTDPDAYRKFLQENQAKEERTELDKLANFAARLKYE